MNDVEITSREGNVIDIEQILSHHRCRFVLDSDQIRLNEVRWCGDRIPADAEDVLNEMWALANRYRDAENRT